MTETTAIRLSHFYPHPQEKVWRALTEPALMARWWAEGNIAPVAGHEFELDMESWGMVPCKVLEVDPPHKLAFSFGEDWTLIWRLEAEEGGTRLYLEHEGFDLSKPADRYAFDNMQPGWASMVLPRLGEVLDEVPA